MSSSGLSKADREIIAQGSNNDRAEEMRRLFGSGSSDITSRKQPISFARDPSPAKRAGHESLKDTKDNIPERRITQEVPIIEHGKDDDEDEDHESRWDRTVRRPNPCKGTSLDWSSFDWKPHHSTFLRGNENWSSYKEAILIQLECIGYEVGMTLMPMDEVKFAAAIHRTTKPEISALIHGMRSGSSIMQTFEKTFQQVGQIQRETLWSILLSFKYTGNCPTTYVTKFKTAVREYQSAGGQLPSSQVMIIFKQSVKEKSGRWHSTVSAISRFQNWKIDQLYQDFISAHFERTGQSAKPNANESGRKALSAQDDRKITPHAKKSPVKGKHRKPRCWSCKQEGHISKYCPERTRNQEGSLNNISIQPTSIPSLQPVSTEEYCKISEEDLIGHGYATQVNAQAYEDLVSFYDAEIASRRNMPDEARSHHNPNNTSLEINLTQQIFSAGTNEKTSDRWLFDTGADIDATNKRSNLRPGTIVDLKPKQFPIRTGNGVVYAECVGEVWLSLTGTKGERTVMMLKYVVCLKTFPLNIVSGERLYRRGGCLERNKIISPRGDILSYINAERRGFFLWLYDHPEPLKAVAPKNSVNFTSTSKQSRPQGNTSNCSPDKDIFRAAYAACWSNGTFTMSEEVMRRLILWHRRLCHPSIERLKWTIKSTIGIDLQPTEIESIPCEACDMGKSLKFTTNERRTRMKNVGEGWHCDVGTLNPVSLEGFGYFCITTEDVSRYRIFNALRKKNEAADVLKSILSQANTELRQNHNLRVKRITIDGGRDWGLTSFQKFASDQEIEVVISAPDNQYQNGVSERGIRFIQDAARCCSIQMKIPSVFWNYLLEMACYTVNLTSQSSVPQHKTPWEIYWSQMDPQKIPVSVEHLLIPGALCITHVDSSHRISGEKLDANGTRSVFLGYRGRTNKLVWLLDGGRFLITPQVTAHESVDHKFGWTLDPREIIRSLPQHIQKRLKERKRDYARNEDYNCPTNNDLDTQLPRGRGRPKRIIQRPYEEQQSLTLSAPTVVDDELSTVLQEGKATDMACELPIQIYKDAVTGRNFVGCLESLEVENERPTSNEVRKAIERQQSSPVSDGDEVFRLMVSYPEIPSYFSASSSDEPNLKQAIEGPERKEWISAIEKEIDGLLSRESFKFIARHAAINRGRLVTSKWVLKKKYKANMELEKYKARIVARGFTQTKGVDYNETSSTTARSASWRILMALATINDWYILQADFIAAYLAGDLKETIFMEQFPQLKEYFSERPKLARSLGYTKESVIQLQKPLYGLKQSGNCWQEKVRSIMSKRGYEPLISDNAIYRNKEANIIVASYVDDFLLIGPNRSDLQLLSHSLNKEVALNDLGDASWFLGIRIRRSSPTGSVMLDHQQYLERSFQEFNISTKGKIETPMSTSCKNDMRKNAEKSTASQLYNFQRLVGKYNFSSCMVRCDTSQATSQMARFMCNPSYQHYQHMLRIPQYLTNSPGRGLMYQKNHRHIKSFGKYGLHCAVDSSFADDYDTAKSTTGYVLFMAGSPVLWRSKLQTTVSTLTCEAEYAAIFEASKECTWIRNFLMELSQMPEGPIPILEDNTGAIKWASNDGMTSGRRHVRIEYHYVTQEVKSGNIDIRYISTDSNPADGLTKPLSSRLFKRFINHLGIQEDLEPCN